MAERITEPVQSALMKGKVTCIFLGGNSQKYLPNLHHTLSRWVLGAACSPAHWQANRTQVSDPLLTPVSFYKRLQARLRVPHHSHDAPVQQLGNKGPGLAQGAEPHAEHVRVRLEALQNTEHSPHFSSLSQLLCPRTACSGRSQGHAGRWVPQLLLQTTSSLPFFLSLR